MPEHRVGLVERMRALPDLSDGAVGQPRHLLEFGVGLGQKLVKRRVEQPDRDRQPAHDRKNFGKIITLHRQEFGEPGAAAALIVGHDHAADRADAVGLEKHMLGARQPDPLGPKATRGGSSSAVSASARPSSSDPVGPPHQVANRRHSGLIVGTSPSLTSPVDPSIVITSPTAMVCRARSSFAPHNRPADRRRPKRRAAPCHALRPRRGWSCRRAWSGCPWRRACHECPRGSSRTRTRITASPRAASISASSAENTTLPKAAPGEAGRPRARTVVLAFGSSVGCSNWSSEATSIRRSPPHGRSPSPRPTTPRSSARPALFACRSASAASTICHAVP